MALNTGLVDRIDWSAIRYRRAGAPWAAGRSAACRGCPGPSPPTVRRPPGSTGRSVSMAGQSTTMSSSSRSTPGSLQQVQQRHRAAPRPGGWPRSRRGTARIGRPGSWTRVAPGRHWPGCRAAGDRGALDATGAGLPVDPFGSGSPPASASASSSAVSRCSRPHHRRRGWSTTTAVESSAAEPSGPGGRMRPARRRCRGRSGSARGGRGGRPAAGRPPGPASRNPPPGSRVNPKNTNRGGRSRIRSPARPPVAATRATARGGSARPPRSRTCRQSRGCHSAASANRRPDPSTSWPAAHGRTMAGRCRW